MTATENKVLNYLKDKAHGERLRMMVLDLFMSRSDLLRILYNLELYGYVAHFNIPATAPMASSDTSSMCGRESKKLSRKRLTTSTTCDTIVMSKGGRQNDKGTQGSAELVRFFVRLGNLLQDSGGAVKHLPFLWPSAQGRRARYLRSLRGLD